MSNDDRISALEKLVADLATQVLLLSEVGTGDVSDGFQERRLNHNASVGSIYEFPQMGGGPIYIPQGSVQFRHTLPSRSAPVTNTVTLIDFLLLIIYIFTVVFSLYR